MNEIIEETKKFLDKLTAIATRLDAKEIELSGREQSISSANTLLAERESAVMAKETAISARENSVASIENFIEEKKKFEDEKKEFARINSARTKGLDDREKELATKEATQKMLSEKLTSDVEAQQIRETEYKDKLDLEFKEKFNSLLDK